jgi:AcrR family transcriptional regulator
VTADLPPYAHLLKRLPVQARSRERVDAILDATAALLADGDLERVTVRAVADVAGVPTGTIYQFFPDKQTLLQALSLRYVAATHDTLSLALATPEGRDWPAALDAVIDGYAAMVRAAPAMRALWLSDAMDAATLSLADEADDEIATRLAVHLQDLAGARPRRDERLGWRVLVGVISGLLKQAFSADPAGSPEILAETRRVARLYAAALLDPRSR